jgi:hypothetical protein
LSATKHMRVFQQPADDPV